MHDMNEAMFTILLHLLFFAIYFLQPKLEKTHAKPPDGASIVYMAPLPVGKPKPQRLSQVTQECMYKAIEIVKPGCRLGDIGEVIQKHAEKNGFSVVREFCGHGIGKVFHEEPLNDV